jgi:hypothetical protein
MKFWVPQNTGISCLGEELPYSLDYKMPSIVGHTFDFIINFHEKRHYHLGVGFQERNALQQQLSTFEH